MICPRGHATKQRVHTNREGGSRMADARRMGNTELFMHFAERVGNRRPDAGEFRADILALEKETEGLLGESIGGSAS